MWWLPVLADIVYVKEDIYYANYQFKPFICNFGRKACFNRLSRPSTFCSQRDNSSSSLTEFTATRIGFKGLAQESTLSPLLFNIYTRDIEACVPRHIKLLQYADDIGIQSTSADATFIQSEIQEAIQILVLKYNDFGLYIYRQNKRVQRYSQKIQYTAIPRPPKRPPSKTVFWIRIPDLDFLPQVSLEATLKRSKSQVQHRGLSISLRLLTSTHIVSLVFCHSNSVGDIWLINTPSKIDSQA